ncbi:MAG: protein kinase [Leptolyngbyaceae cyanobacterium SL_7_1]|nr:protein kinase [Leptolyngbyaceae cyanobacterium SL_7_1]
MSYCLNPRCSRPQNPDNANFCQTCGMKLRVNDRYRPLKLIGQGGFGRTFLAIDEAADEGFCVIKQAFSQERLPDDRARIFSRREAQQLAQLGRHPQIPTLLDYVEQEDSQYLIQEFIDGENLESALRDHGTFEEPEIRQLLEDLLPVVRFIHQQRVIHRDIKPENIICPYRGGKLFLVDFGASKYTSDTALGRTGTVIGSAAFVAPEQAMGRAEFASDLYSLGVTCVHLLTGLHPFDLYSISQDAWVWQQYLPHAISAQLHQVLDRMVQRATSQRYRTATAILRDLGIEVVSASPVRRSPTLTASRRPPNAIVPASRPRPPWQCIHTLTGHTSSITAVALSPTGETIASGGVDRTIRFWDTTSGRLIATLPGRSLWSTSGHGDRLSALTFACDGTLISSSDDGTVKCWDGATRKLQTTLPGQGWGIAALAISGDGTVLASGGGDGSIHLWNPIAPEKLGELTKDQVPITGLALSPDGQFLASSDEQTIRLWDLRDRYLMNTFKGHLDRIQAIAITPDWQILLSASWDKTVKLWHLQEGGLLRTIAAHGDRILCLAISPKGNLFATGCDDGTIAVWNLQHHRDDRFLIHVSRLTTLHHSWAVNALSFSADGQMLVSGSADETVKVWRSG